MNKNYWKILLVLFVITSCKKEVTEFAPPPGPTPGSPLEPAPTRMIAIITQAIFNGNSAAIYTQEFTYDDQHRVKEIRENANKVLSMRKVYTYLQNKVELRGYNANGNPEPILDLDYYLNEKGLVEETRANYNNYRSLYEYNDQGFLKRSLYFSSGKLESFRNYYYGANNVLDSVTLDTPNEKLSVTVYTYDRSKPNTVDNASIGMVMLGKSQPFPIVKESLFFYNIAGNIGRRLIYTEDDNTHTFVNDNRLMHTNIRRTGYAYPGPVVTTGLFGSLAYTYR